MKKLYRINKLNQNAWLKPYIDMSTDMNTRTQEKNQKMILKNIFF